MRLRVELPDDPALVAILERHPEVDLGPPNPLPPDRGRGPELVFHQGDWRREVRVGDPTCEVRGLVELMDNNPMVCSDVVSVPTPGSTLALIALGPLAKTGLLLEAPTLLANCPLEDEDVANYLSTEGWDGGVLGTDQPEDLDGVIALTAIAAIRVPSDPQELGEIYEECFGRSFYVHRDTDSPWHIQLVKGTANAIYRLSLSREDEVGLLTVKVMADRDGKCGAAQIVHAMNVMAGFEESLGI